MISHFFSRVYHYFTYFLSPPFCLFCSLALAERQALCQSCSVQILPVIPFDFYCGKDKNIRIFAFSAYKDPLRSLILAKHSGNETYVHLVADFVVQHTKLFEQIDFDYIVCIPLHWTRYARRGFNQAEILAQHIAKKSGKPLLPLLKRSKMTKFQARLSVHQRQTNVHDAFQVRDDYTHLIAHKKILVVDDLFTTGSTMKSAASILWKYQPAQINGFVICRVVG